MFVAGSFCPCWRWLRVPAKEAIIERTQRNRLTGLWLLLEGMLLLVMSYAFWHHSPPLRDQWVWLLWLAIPAFRIRMALVGHFWTWTPLNDLLLLFLLLTAYNFANAPFARNDYVIVMSRPLLGIWVFLYCLEVARATKRLHGLLLVLVGASLLLGAVALTTTQWAMAKSAPFAFLIAALPRFDYNAYGDAIRNLLLGFNPNEVAGALAWLAPLMAGLALGSRGRTKAESAPDWLWRALRVGAGLAFALLFVALFVGQSRFAIAGVLGSLVLLIVALVPHSARRYALLGAVGVVALLQAALVLNVFNPAAADAGGGLSARDQRTFSTRFELWERGVRMMVDYPTTGTGMSMYRTAVSQPEYVIQYYVEQGFPPPHAHNEWIQMGADLGVPGFLLYIGWQLVVLWMLWKGWRSGDERLRIVAAAVFAGLLAHAAYGLGDAVTLWDRFSIVLWALVGLAGAQYVLAVRRDEDVPDSRLPYTVPERDS